MIHSPYVRKPVSVQRTMGLVLIALLPGMPMLPFLALAGGVGYLAFRSTGKKATALAKVAADLIAGKPPAPTGHEEAPISDSLKIDELKLELGYGLLSLKYSHEAGGLELWVEELYVRPAFRGRGLGHEFFAWLRGLAAAEHIRRIRLETEPENERAAALYARMGFSPLGYCQMFREEAT